MSIAKNADISYSESTMEKRIRGILFDKDGTLFNYGEVWGSVIDNMLRANIPMDRLSDERKEQCLHEFEVVIGVDRNGCSYSDGILFRHNNIPMAILRILRICLKYFLNIYKVIKAVMLLMKRSDYGVEEKIKKMNFSDVRRVFRAAKDRGMIIGIVTNDIRRSTNLFIERMGVEDLISFVRCGDSECRKKPNPEAIHQFCEEYEITEEEVAVVGDTLIDMEFARNGKVGYSIALLSGSGDKDALEKTASIVYPELIDIISDPVLFPKKKQC